MKWLFYLITITLLFSGVTFFHLQKQPFLAKETVTKSPHNFKHDHLILGPPAGHGIDGRLQCEGLTALVPGFEAKTPCLFQGEEKVSIVTFFVTQNQHSTSMDADSSKIKLGDRIVSKADRPFAILNVFVESIQASMPQSEIVILSNPNSRIPQVWLPKHASFVRMNGDYSVNNLMLQRLESYIAYLARIYTAQKDNKEFHNSFHHNIFMDSDIIVSGDLGCIFEDYPEFDMALTFRNNKLQPLNSGVIMIRGKMESLLRAMNFLKNVVMVYKDKFKSKSRIMGDQLALTWALLNQSNLDVSKFKKSKVFETHARGTRILMLPCSKYNWTPSEGAGQFRGMPEDVQVIHFKGSRKRLMLASWNFYHTSNESIWNMKCLILRSGRTKYDF